MAGLTDDHTALAIARLTTGEHIAETELTFTLREAHDLACAALSGERRALTTPGIARKLSATVAVLFRVCLAAGIIIEGDLNADSHSGDRD